MGLDRAEVFNKDVEIIEITVPTVSSGTSIASQKYVNISPTSGSAVLSTTRPTVYGQEDIKGKQIMGFELGGVYYPLPMETGHVVSVNDTSGYTIFVLSYTNGAYKLQWSAGQKHTGRKIKFHVYKN